MSIKNAAVLIAIAMSALAPAGAHAADEDKGEAGWGKGAYFESSDGKFSLELGSRVQVRYTQDDPDGGDSTGSFRVRRAKLSLKGRVYGDVEYKVQAAWSGGSTTLEDAYFEFARNPLATLWVGQGKVFFGRQELTSSGKQQFVDRSITSARFAHGRDQGLALIGETDAETFSYQVGVYNGNGPNRSGDDNTEKLIAGRVVFTPFGEYKLEESAIGRPDSPRLAIGVAALSSTEDAGAAEVDVNRLGVELAYKIGGWSTVAEYFTEDADLVAGGSSDSDGYYAQVGYLFPNDFEVAGRYAVVSPDVAGASADEIETGVALSYYVAKHDYKIQADYRNIEDELANADDRQIRVQLQLAW